MSLADDIRAEVRQIYKKNWDTRDGEVVPETESIQLGNQAVKLQATVLYADLADSTKMVDAYNSHFAAEVYKAFLITACRIIRNFEGSITAFDGDRVMAVYIGNSKNTNAVTSRSLNERGTSRKGESGLQLIP